jgi:hypothetical protein
MSVRIRPCRCVHEYQDEKYGKGQRVHNLAKGKQGQAEWTCTVCKDRKQD